MYIIILLDCVNVSCVSRFESTIVGQFFGHTHHDSVEIFFDNVNLTRATKWDQTHSFTHLHYIITPLY